MEKKQSIKNWALDDRPREKLLKNGISTLSNAELIAILIGSGNTKQTAVELSRTILQHYGNNLNALGKLIPADLMQFNGIGEAKAISIVAALELGRRRKMEDVLVRQKIGSSKDAFDLFQSIISDLPYEEFWVLLLNRANNVLEYFKLSQGGTAGTVIDVKIILKRALEKLAHGIIIAHNHPSGNRNPSDADKRITQKLKDAAKLLEIQLLDHIIVADNQYFSFADEGLI
jgi:DNA repair protein RadC